MNKLLVCIAFLLPLQLYAQLAQEHKQQKLSKWDIGTAQYSGITAMGNGRYAVVSDKEPTDGFFVFCIAQDSVTGEVTNVEIEGFFGNRRPFVDNKGFSLRDTEGIAYYHSAATIFISGEGDQQILEYDLQGQPTGRGLKIPYSFGIHNIYSNYGFEALTYNATSQRFWTTTESTLRSDGVAAGPNNPGVHNLLRLQSFDNNLRPAAQYAYRMERSRLDDFGKFYACGVTALAALPDGRLAVLERELNVPKGYMGAEVINRVFMVSPNEAQQIDSSVDLRTLDNNFFLFKTPIAHFVTQLHPYRNTYANYEAMCLGATLADGRQTLLLLNDSQANTGFGPYRLKDYIKVLVL